MKAQIISATEGVKASELSRQLVLQGLRKEQADALIEQISGNEAITSNTILTKEQTAAILEQAEARKLLSAEQRQNIANDIEESASSVTEATAEIAQASSELAESTAKVGTTSSILARGVSQLGTGMKSLLSIFVSSPTAIIATLTGSIIGLTYIIGKFQDSAKNAAKAASDFASSMSSINSTYDQETQTLNELTEKYQDLREQLIAAKGNEEETYSIKSQMLELQKQLNEIYGDEYDKVNLVTDAYRDQTDELKKNAKQKAENYLNENYDKIEEAKDKLLSERTYELGNFNYGLQDANLGNELHRQIKQLAKDSGIEWDDKKGFVFKGTAEDASKAINQFMTDVTNLKNAQSNLPDSIEENLSAFSSSMSKQLGYADEIIKGYQETYETAQMAQIASDTNLSKGYNQAIDAIEKYNDAVLRSENPYDDENVKKAWDNLQTIKNGIKENEAEWGQYSNIMDDVFSTASDDAYSFYQTMQNDDSISKLTDDLQGLSDTDLQSMADDGVEDSFDKLCQKANEYGLEVQDVIELLLQLGVAQGKVEESVPDETDILSFSDAWNSEDFEDARKELLSLAEAGQLTPETLQSTEEYKTLLEQTGLSAEEATKQINALVSASTQLQSMSAQISKMSDMLADKKNGTTATADDLAGFDAEVRGLDSWQEFEKVMGSTTSTIEECQAAANALASEWINNGNFLANLTDQNRDYYETQLKNMGIENAHIIVLENLVKAGYELSDAEQAELGKAIQVREEIYALQVAEAQDFIAKKDLKAAAEDAYAGLIKEAEGAGISKAALFDLIYQQNIFSNQKLNVYDKIAALQELAESFGITADAALGASQAINLENQLRLVKHYGGSDADVEAYAAQLTSKVQDGIKAKFANLSTTISPSGSKDYKKSGSTDKKGSDSKQTIDWISRLLDVLQKKIDTTKAKFDNLFTLKNKKNNLAEQITLTKGLLTATTVAADRYKKAASKVGLSKELKAKVENGSYDINEYDSKTSEKIQKYQSYIDSYNDLKKQEEELTAEIRNLKIGQKQLYVDDADARKDIIDSEIELITSGKSKNKLEKEKIKYIKQSYNKQIEIAKIEKDSVKVSQLRIDKEKELLAVKKEILQNTLDQNDKEMALLDVKYQNATTAKEKNKILDQKDTIGSKNVEAYSNAYKDAKKNVTSSGKTVISSTKTVKSLSDSDRKKIESYISKGKKIPDDLLKKVKSVDGEWYDLLVQYNNNYIADPSSVINAIKKAKVSQKTQDSLEKAINSGKSISQKTLNGIKKKDSTLYNSLSNWNKGQKERESIINTVSSTKTLTESDKKKIKSLVNAKKPITDALLQKVASANPSLYAKLVDYNNKLDYLDESKYNLDVAKEQDKTDKANNAKEQFDNLQSQYENRISILNSKAESLNGQIGIIEAKGYVVSADYYNSLTTNTKKNLSELTDELVALRQKRDEMLKDGTLKKGSDDWYEIQSVIWSVKNAQDNATKSLIEYEKQIRQLKWDAFDRQEDFISQIQDEGNWLIDLMNNEKLFDDSGNWTEYANATAGLRAVNYNAYMAQADDYEKEIKSIQQEINNDPYNIDLIKRKQELISTQRDLIKSAEQEKESIKSLVSDGYNKWLDALQKSIDLRKNELDSVSDLYSYQKKISELTKNVSTYEKLQISLSGDNSEETKAQLQQVNAKLQDVKNELAESEYEQWKTDQTKMLDNLSDNAQEWINQRLDDIDGLILNVIDTTNSNSDSIKDTLEKVTSDVGTTLSSDMSSIWSATDGVSKVVSEYGDRLNVGITTVGNTLTSIKDYVAKISNASDKLSDTSTDYDFNPVQYSQKEQVSDFINRHKQEATRERDYYRALNQYIYDATGGYVLSKTDEASLANLLNVNVYSDLTGDAGRIDLERILAALKLTGYAKGGVISSIKDAIRLNGDSVLVSANPGERVLTVEQNENWEKWTKELPNLVNLTDVIKPNLNIPATVNRNVGNSIGDVEMTINLPNVTNYDEFKSNLIKDKQIEKFVQTVTFGNALGGNTLNKYRIR